MLPVKVRHRESFQSWRFGRRGHRNTVAPSADGSRIFWFQEEKFGSVFYADGNCAVLLHLELNKIKRVSHFCLVSVIIGTSLRELHAFYMAKGLSLNLFPFNFQCHVTYNLPTTLVNRSSRNRLPHYYLYIDFTACSFINLMTRCVLRQASVTA